MPAHIIGIRGLHDGKLVMLGDTPITFGRTPENSLPIDDQLTSRRHAEIRRESHGFVLYDLGSSNGTLVNGQRIQAHLLASGDEFEVGTAVFRFDQIADVAPLGKTVLSPPSFGDEEEMTTRSSPFAFELVAVRGPLAGQRFPLGLDAVSLGRTPDNIVQLQSPRASRKHCEIRPQGGQLILVDLNSSNGTSVNGQRVPTALLQPGDEVSIGEEGYVVVRTGEEPMARAAPAAPAVPEPMAYGAPPAYAPPPGPPAAPLFGAPPATAVPVAAPPPLFGAPPPPPPPPPVAYAPPAPPPPLPVPSFLGVTAPPQPFGGPPPIGVPRAPSAAFGVEDKTEPPPAMPGFTPGYSPPQQSSTGFSPVKAAPPAPGGFAPPPGPPPGPGGFGPPPGPPPGPGGFGPPPGPPPRPSGGFAPVGPPPAAPPGNFARPAAPEAPTMINCPMCQRAVDARYTHCPYDATPLPTTKPAW